MEYYGTTYLKIMDQKVASSLGLQNTSPISKLWHRLWRGPTYRITGDVLRVGKRFEERGYYWCTDTKAYYGKKKMFVPPGCEIEVVS